MFSWTIVKYANALNCHVKLLRCSVGKLGNCLHGKSALFKTIFVLFFLVNESCSELFVRLTGHGIFLRVNTRKWHHSGQFSGAEKKWNNVNYSRKFVASPSAASSVAMRG